MQTIKPNNSTDAGQPVVCVEPANPTLSVGEPAERNFVSLVPSEQRSLFKPYTNATVTIILIGETGTGKTAFLSLLVNHLLGKGVFEMEEVHDEHKESGLSKSQSQTTKASLYTVTTREGSQLRILDTPGLADTRGLSQDELHKAEINDAVKEFVTSIDAILILANGTIERLTAATAYSLETIAAMFPHSIADNIGLVLTHSTRKELNFQIDSLPFELRGRPWVVQNPLALLKNYKATVNQSTPADIDEEWRQDLEHAHSRASRELRDFFEWLGSRDAKPTHEIHDLYERSVRIESRIEETIASLTRLAEKRAAWEGLYSQLENAQHYKGAVEATIREQTQGPVWTYKPSSEYNVVCLVADCHSNCHSPCGEGTLLGLFRYLCSAFTLADISSGDSSWFRSPAKLLLSPFRRTCKVCGHSASDHRRYQRTHVQIPATVDEGVMEKLNCAQTEEQKLQAAERLAQKELNDIQTEAEKIQYILRNLVIGYSDLALSKNFVGPLRSAIHMLELRENELHSKTGTEAELKLVRESIAKLKTRMNLLEEQAKAFPSTHQVVTKKAMGLVRVVLWKRH